MHEGSCKKLMGELILSINVKELPANNFVLIIKNLRPLQLLAKGGTDGNTKCMKMRHHDAVRKRFRIIKNPN